MTPAEIEAALRARYPTLSVSENGRVRTLTPAQYEARIAEMAAAEVAQQASTAATAAWQAMVTQFTDGRVTLQSELDTVNARIAANTALSAAETRVGFRDLLKAMIWLSDRIKDGTIVIKQP